MGRDGTISADKLITLLDALPPKSRLTPNNVGNLLVYGYDKKLGYIDLVQESFWPLGIMIEDDPNDTSIAGSKRRITDAVSRFRTVGYEERQSADRESNVALRERTDGYNR